MKTELYTGRIMDNKRMAPGYCEYIGKDHNFEFSHRTLSSEYVKSYMVNNR